MDRALLDSQLRSLLCDQLHYSHHDRHSSSDAPPRHRARTAQPASPCDIHHHIRQSPGTRLGTTTVRRGDELHILAQCILDRVGPAILDPHRPLALHARLPILEPGRAQLL